MIELKSLIFLAGFMGSGKSTIGPLLATRIHYDFVDADSEIELAERMTIREIFETHGEKYFRGLEERVLRDIADRNRNMVVALGGGALTSQKNRALVNERGLLVYLKSDARSIIRRVRTKGTRPMLLSPDGQPLGDEELIVRVESLLKERERHYLEASIVVDTSGSTISKSVEEIVSKLRERGV